MSGQRMRDAEELMRRVDALTDEQRANLLRFLCGYAQPTGLTKGLNLVAPEGVSTDA